MAASSRTTVTTEHRKENVSLGNFYAMSYGESVTEAETVQDDLLAAPEQCEGIGGLLARTENWKLDAGAPFASAFYHSDGNGNVTFLMYTNGMQAAKYLYDPFGNMLAMSGPLAAANKYRFSSKEWNDDTGLYYYGYRFYDPDLQRWPNQDPLSEIGYETLRNDQVWLSTKYLEKPAEVLEGPDLYEYVDNDAIDDLDSRGLSWWGKGGGIGLGGVIGFSLGYWGEKQMDGCPGKSCNLAQCNSCCQGGYDKVIDGALAGGIIGAIGTGGIGTIASGGIAATTIAVGYNDYEQCKNKCLQAHKN